MQHKDTGVTKWKRGITDEQISLENLEVVELHPELLNEEWSAYAAFVLHHEFIHALGYRNHDKFFRLMENSWPALMLQTMVLNSLNI